MTDRPESFRYDSGYGTVSAVYPESWEVDILTAHGGKILRATVLGPRLPEVSTKERPQWVRYGHANHSQGEPWCEPIQSQLGGDRTDRKDYVYYEEALNFRITIDRAGVFEVRNHVRPLQFRVQEEGVIRLDTPTSHFVQDDNAKSIELDAEEKITATCKDAEVQATNDVKVLAGNEVQVLSFGDLKIVAVGKIEMTSGDSVKITAPRIDLNP